MIGNNQSKGKTLEGGKKKKSNLRILLKIIYSIAKRRSTSQILQEIVRRTTKRNSKSLILLKLQHRQLWAINRLSIDIKKEVLYSILHWTIMHNVWPEGSFKQLKNNHLKEKKGWYVTSISLSNIFFVREAFHMLMYTSRWA